MRNKARDILNDIHIHMHKDRKEDNNVLNIIITAHQKKKIGHKLSMLILEHIYIYDEYCFLKALKNMTGFIIKNSSCVLHQITLSLVFYNLENNRK